MASVSSPFTKVLTTQLSAENLRGFSIEIFQSCASILPGAKEIIFGAPPSVKKELPDNLKPNMKDAIYDEDDVDKEYPFFKYGIYEDERFKFTNPTAFSVALTQYEKAKEKRTLLLAQFLTLTLSNVSDESLIIMKSCAGSDWLETSIDATKCWSLIRLSHKLNTNNALLFTLNNYMTHRTLEGSVASFCNSSVELKDEFESVFSDFLDCTVRQFTEILSSLMFVDSFIKAGVLPLTCDHFINDPSSVLSPANILKDDSSSLFANVMKTFSQASKNSVVNSLDGTGSICYSAVRKVGELDPTIKTSTTACSNCNESFPSTWNTAGILNDLCKVCYKVLKLAGVKWKSLKASALVLPKTVMMVKGPGNTSTILNPSPKERIASTNGPSPAKKVIPTIPQKKDTTTSLAASKKAVSFSAVCNQFGISMGHAALLIANAAEEESS